MATLITRARDYRNNVRAIQLSVRKAHELVGQILDDTIDISWYEVRQHLANAIGCVDQMLKDDLPPWEVTHKGVDV